MKKTFPVNINGKIFYIDEDAYSLLQNYLDQIHQAFGGTEGDEIVGDIENRISELFDERIAAGAHAIVYADVNNVIEIMGKPSDISDGDPKPDRQPQAESDDKTCDSNNSSNSDSVNSNVTVGKRLYRNVNNKVFGGVIGGLAAYLGWDANIMRLLYVVLSFFTYFWPLAIIYLIAWMVIPAANTPRRVLEQQGFPVTVDNIGQNVLQSTPPPYPGNNSDFSPKGVVTTIFSLIGKFCMTILGLIGSVGALVATGFFVFFLVAFIAYTCFHDIILLDFINPHFVDHVGTMVPTVGCLALMSFALCFIIPALALAWAAASYLFNYKGAAKATVFIALILETVFIVATVILFIFTDKWLYAF